MSPLTGVRCCLFVLMWLVLAPAGLRAQPASLEEGQAVLPLGPFLEQREDPAGTLDLEALRAQPSFWKPVRGDGLNPGFSRSAWWLRLSVRNDSPHPRHLLLDTRTALADYVDLHVTSADGRQQRIETGDRRAFVSRPMNTRTLVLPLSLAAGETVDIHLRLASWDGLHEPVTPLLWNANDYAGHLQTEALLFGLYFGILLAILLYNLFLYLSTREAGFLLYLQYLGLFLLWNFAFRGYAHPYLWPDWPHLNNQILPLASGLAYFSLGRFSLAYLEADRRAPRGLVRLLWLAMISNLLAVTPALFGHYALTFACAVPTGAFMVAVTLATALRLLRQGSRPARFFLLAFSLLGVGVGLYYLQMLGWVPATPLTEYGLQIGSCLETLLLGFGLADQMNRLKTDKLKAEQDARAAQDRLNTQLASEVQQRTAELEQANQRLNTLAITDELTGAFNRRHFNAVFETEFASHCRQHTPFAFCMLDIDHFKTYNDRFGHQAGDQVLRDVAQCLHDRLRRSNDYLFRLGGEEFAILICMDQPPEQSLPYMEQLRQAIADLAIPHPDNAAGVVTASLGLLTLGNGSPLTRSSDVYARADALLYQAKSGGRNRVVHQAL